MQKSSGAEPEVKIEVKAEVKGEARIEVKSEVKAETESELEPQGGKQVEPREGEKIELQERERKKKERLRRTQATENEKRLSGMQATEFLEAKFKNEFEFLKSEQQAQQAVLAKYQHQSKKTVMKGGSSFASKYQTQSVEEECPAVKDGFDKIYYDETTGAVLDPKLVAAAVQEELDFMRQLKVYHEVPAEFAAQNCLRPIETRWIYTNKGDAKNPQIRARLVAQETKRNSDLMRAARSLQHLPQEGLRFMLSKCMTGPRAKVSETAVLGFYDISRAHFHSAARRKIVIRTPPEDTGCPSGFALLDKSMYGTKDAAQCFDVACENAMAKMGYTIGLFSPCLYLHKTENLAVFRHGDDFVVCGTRTQQAEFKSELGQYFIVKQLGPALGVVPEVRILNRLVRWGRAVGVRGRPQACGVACAPAGAQLFIQGCVHAGGKEQAQRRFWDTVGS